MYRAILIDVDGVVKRGQTIIPRVHDAIHTLRSKKVSFMLVTNNSTKTPEQLSSELVAGGLDVSPKEIMTSSQVLVDLLKRNTRLSSKAKEGVLVVGEKGVVEELEKNGYPTTNQPTSGMVVVGLDRGFTYEKLAAATRSVMMGAVYVATNTDRTYPTENGPMPGAGSIVAAITASANRRPISVGKPSKTFFESALGRLGVKVERSEVLVVGDRPETDIKMAKAAGCDSVLVLSGVTEGIEGLKIQHRPTYVFQDLYEAIERLL